MIEIAQLLSSPMANFVYVVWCKKKRESIVIDPSGIVDEIKKFINDKNLKLNYVILTHSHPDHTVGYDALSSYFNAKSCAHRFSPLDVDIYLNDGDVLTFGKEMCRILHTPGHTPDSICLLIKDCIFTGDTLFIDGCGRTDLPGGDSNLLLKSIKRLGKLNDSTIVYPGHNYASMSSSTIGREKKYSPIFKYDSDFFEG